MTADEAIVHYLESGSLDEEALAALPEREQARVRATTGELDVTRDALADPALWVDVPAGLEDRILDALDAATDAEPAAANPAGPGPSAPVVSLAVARERRYRRVAIVASVAAGVAILLAVVGFTRSPSTSSDVAGPTVTSTSRLLAEGSVTLHATSARLPGASGTVTLTERGSGVEIVLRGAGMPRLPEGELYEAWVRTEQGLVPIGTFHTGDDVILWSGVGLDGIEAVTVTLEKNDGDQSSSGDRVLLFERSPATPGADPTTVGSTR